jgi:hypothetical protein
MPIVSATAADVLFLGGSGVFEASARLGATGPAAFRSGALAARSYLEEVMNGERENVAVYALHDFSGVRSGAFVPAWVRTSVTERKKLRAKDRVFFITIPSSLPYPCFRKPYYILWDFF